MTIRRIKRPQDGWVAVVRRDGVTHVAHQYDCEHGGPHSARRAAEAAEQAFKAMPRAGEVYPPNSKNN